MILAVGNDGQFARFCAVAGCAELARDPRFARNADRVRHRADAGAAARRDAEAPRRARDWLAALEAAKVPCGPINDLADVFADPQVQARGMTVELPHPLAGAVRLVASPIKLSATPVRYRPRAAAARRRHRRTCWPSSASTPRRSRRCASAGAI